MCFQVSLCASLPVSLLKGLRVLVVENNFDSSCLLTTLFESYDIEAIVVTTVAEAIKAVETVKPDLLISEIALPDEDGYMLMHKLKNLEQESQIPAIALTTLTSDLDKARARAAGFCQHLSKPISLDELISTVACLSEQSQSISAS